MHSNTTCFLCSQPHFQYSCFGNWDNPVLSQFCLLLSPMLGFLPRIAPPLGSSSLAPQPHTLPSLNSCTTYTSARTYTLSHPIPCYCRYVCLSPGSEFEGRNPVLCLESLGSMNAHLVLY